MPSKELKNVVTLQILHDLAFRIFLLHDSSLKTNRENHHLSAQKIKDSRRDVTNTNDYHGSARNILRDHNINGPVARKKSLVSQANRLKRFSFGSSKKIEFGFLENCSYAVKK